MDAGDSCKRLHVLGCDACRHSMLFLTEPWQTKKAAHKMNLNLYLLDKLPLYSYNISTPSGQNAGLLVDGGH